MEIKSFHRYVFGIRFAIIIKKKEVARAHLYILHNDLHQKPFGLLEDLWVAESQRHKGYGRLLAKRIITEAKEHGCYKLIATSRQERPLVHGFYKDLGFQDYGKEFRFEI